MQPLEVVVVARKWRSIAVCFTLIFAIAVPATFSQFDFTPPSGTPGGEEIDFGAVPVGQTRSAQYTFTVLASSDTSVQVTIYDPCPPFGLSGLASQSMVLQPGQSVTFGVTFTPPQAQAYTCSFVIRAAGGYPVQVMETVVQLSGQGISGTAAPSEEPGSASPGFPIVFPFTEAPLPEAVQGVSGTTDNEGKFDVTVMPASTVTGRLLECDGPALSNREFRITPLDDGYEIAVLEFKPVVAQPAAKISLFGMESIDLGEVCVEPVIEEVIEQPTSLGTDESETCPCCSIIVEAQMCCNPGYHYVETSTIYEPQLVRIRVAYCEPPEDLGNVDLTPLPLTNTGGILVNPGLMPSPSGLDPGQVGVTSITLNGESLFEGDGEFEKTVHVVGTLQSGMHTVGATIGRFDGEECVCEKTFEVLPCPDVDATLERTVVPTSSCAPVQVTYDLNWPGGMSDICELYLGYPDALYLNREFSLSFTDRLTALDSCDARHVEPKFSVNTSNCCAYELAVEPFVVTPPFRMADDCVCLRLVPNEDGTTATQLVFDWKAATADRPSCILCENYNLRVDWGDGTSSNQSDVVGISPSCPDESTITHQYETEGEDPRLRFNIAVNIGSDCGSLSKIFTTACPFVTDLIPDAELVRIEGLASRFTGPDDVFVLVNNLIGIFDQVGRTQGNATVCSVLLDIQLKGLDMGDYADFDTLVSMFSSDVAGGVFQRTPTDRATGSQRSRFYAPSAPPETDDWNSATLVYIHGESPYFMLTILRGGCGDCPVFPSRRVVSALTDIQAKRQATEAREGLRNPSGAARSTVPSQTSIVILEIGLCCPPDLCEE